MSINTLDWISSERERMIALVEKWANINSGSTHLSGLATQCDFLQSAFESLKGKSAILPVHPFKTISDTGEMTYQTLGSALHIQKYPEAPIQIFLGGHMDTVFGKNHPFQQTRRISPDQLLGPGVTDMKGGLVILLKVLEAYERSPFAGKIGWEVLINADEELGSPGSAHLFAEIAGRKQFGLLFEPALPDGALVDARKGSLSVTVISTGKSAHVGRDFFSGKNALTGLARFALKAETITNKEKGILLNIGRIQGGGAINQVPDKGSLRLNIRIDNPSQQEEVLRKLKHFAQEETEVQIDLYEETKTPPKPFDPPMQRLFEAYAQCAKELEIPFASRPSGGTCDGNRLYAFGLPNLDTLGAVGGHIHTSEEYLDLNSLVERAKLSALFLFKLAQGDFKLC